MIKHFSSWSHQRPGASSPCRSGWLLQPDLTKGSNRSRPNPHQPYLRKQQPCCQRLLLRCSSCPDLNILTPSKCDTLPMLHLALQLLNLLLQLIYPLHFLLAGLACRCGIPGTLQLDGIRRVSYGDRRQRLVSLASIDTRDRRMSRCTPRSVRRLSRR